MTTTPLRSWLPAYCAIGLAWGCSFLFIKWGLDFLTPFGVAFVRCALGATTLLFVALVRGIALPRERVLWLHLFVVAMCINVVPGVLFALAESRTTTILAGIINAITPLTSLFFIAVVFRDEPLSTAQLVGLAVGFLGVLVVLGAWRGLGTYPWWAITSLLVAVTLYGFSFPYTRRYLTPRRLPPVALASAQLSLAALTLVPAFWLDGTNGQPVTLRGMGAVIALGVFGSGLAFMWNFRVIEAVGSSRASTVTYITPLVAVLVGVLVLHESLAWFQPLGAILVLVGAAVGQGRLRLGR